MESLKMRDRKSVWHPYTHLKRNPEAIAIVRGAGAWLEDEDGNRYLDAISSWWVNLHGHAHPHIAERIARQAQQLEHCIFAGFTHEPAIELAERLLNILPGPMSRIFYSDNGSTAVEVALKMALQYSSNKGYQRSGIVAIEHSYHGDTFGAMSVSSRSLFTSAFSSKLFEAHFIPFPSEANLDASLQMLERLLQTGEIAAFIAEPLVLGSGGMLMYDADTLELMFRLCRKYGVLVIADEVMTGFGRTGPLFACDYIATAPDIICLSKGLTGGALPMGVTATTQAVFDAFYDDDPYKTLYHGHSYTANPLACAAALASLDLVLDDECTASRMRIVRSHAAFLAYISGHAAIAASRQTGTILAIELKTEHPSYLSSLRDFAYRFFLDRGILMRPLGNIIYIFPPYCISGEELSKVYAAIQELLEVLPT